MLVKGATGVQALHLKFGWSCFHNCPKYVTLFVSTVGLVYLTNMYHYIVMFLCHRMLAATLLRQWYYFLVGFSRWQLLARQMYYTVKQAQVKNVGFNKRSLRQSGNIFMGVSCKTVKTHKALIAHFARLRSIISILINSPPPQPFARTDSISLCSVHKKKMIVWI